MDVESAPLSLAGEALSLAELFALPIDDPRHRRLRDRAWLYGPEVEGRYYLGKYVQENLFLTGHGEYEERLRCSLRGALPAAGWLLQSRYWHDGGLLWLRHVYRRTDEHERFPLRRESKETLAIVLLLERGILADHELQAELGCSIAAMQRWVKYRQFRREWVRIARPLEF